MDNLGDVISVKNCKKGFLINNNSTKIENFAIIENYSFLVKTMEALQAHDLSLSSSLKILDETKNKILESNSSIAKYVTLKFNNVIEKNKGIRELIIISQIIK